MTEELKGCPFCGGATRFHTDEDCLGCHYIECSGCKAMFDFSPTTDPENECDSLHDLQCGITHAWNTRAQQPSQWGEAVVTDAFVPGSLADLLFQLGEKGIQVSGGTHGDHWAVALPGASVAVPVKSCTEQVEILAHLYMGAFSAGELGEIDIDLVTPNAERLQQELVRGEDVTLSLMTVAQHNRIMAAATRPADQVAEGSRVVSVEFLKNWVTGLQCGIISQRRVLEDLRELLEAKP